MKRAIISIMTVMMLAACSEEGILSIRNFDQEPDQAIGFNIFTDKATRAFPTDAQALTIYHNQFVVFSTKTSTIDNEISEVFNGDTVSYNNGWKYNPLRFWDKKAKYSFVAIAPSAKYIIYTKTDSVANPAGDYVTKDGGYTLVGTNLQDGTRIAEINKGFTGDNGRDADLMTAQKNNQNGAAHTETVDMLFSHILAKLNVTIGKAKVLDGQDVYIKKVEITGLDNHGTYAQKRYTAAQSGWTSSKNDTASNYKLAWNAAPGTNGVALNPGSGEGQTYTPGTPKYFIESIIMPQSIENATTTSAGAEKLYMEYSINGQPYKYELNFKYNDTLKKVLEPTVDSIVVRSVFPEFMDRSKYTLKLTIDPDVITFDARAAMWTTSTETTQTVK